VVGPKGTWPGDALLDTGADDTVFPESVAAAVGIDLSGSPTGTSSGIAQGSIGVRYAVAKLRIAGSKELREWDAWIAFTPGRIRQPLLGFAGFLQYFDATFFGVREEVELSVNGAYRGT
jgi:predicted aspartyl protease